MNLKSYEFQLAIRLVNNRVKLCADKSVLLSYKFIKNPISRWLADPFLFEFNGNHFIFAESASRITGKGKLVYCKINLKKINKCKWKKCMSKKFHLSFPNIRIENGVISMIPETYQDCCVAEYVLKKVDKFDSWVKSCEIAKNVEFVDTIIFNDLFITYDISSEPFSLKLLSSNGIVLDKINDVNLSLRPAGKIFNINEKMVFVSQNCKNIYGEGLLFNYFYVDNSKMIINQFYSIDYCDLNHLFKRNNFVGIHTYNFDSMFEIVDVRTEKFNFFGLLGKIFEKAKTKHKGKEKDQ